jgi:uncharacterized protein (TIGR04141 family)
MDDAKIGLTVFLLREGQVASFREALVDSHPQSIPLSPPLSGVFLPFPSTSGTPAWVGALLSLLTNPVVADMAAKSPGGLLVVEEQNRTFVISFGHAWQKLDDQWLERDFGLRVALNVIPKDEVVEIKSEQVFAKWHLASERAPRAASVEEFGIDFDRDLVAVVEGVPKGRPSLGSLVRGSTSLRLKLPINELQSALATALGDFGSEAYKKDWPDIEKVHQITDPTIIELLEDQLGADMQDEKARRKIVLFTPSQRRGESLLADSYVYGRLTEDAGTSPYLTINGVMGALARRRLTLSVGEAKKLLIHILDEESSEAYKCTAFDCFGYEFSDKNQVYILSSGVWYEVVPDFIGRINATIKKIGKPKLPLPAWNQKDSEAEYNAKCALDDDFLNCDRRILHYGGGQSKFEFCDLLHLKSKTLFFAKIPSKSTGMSHLIEQVRRTTQLLFATDNGYRQKLSKMFAKYHSGVDVRWLDERPRQGDWDLCMVSLGVDASSLPFFAKCGLAKIYKDLAEQGHTLSFIAV